MYPTKSFKKKRRHSQQGQIDKLTAPCACGAFWARRHGPEKWYACSVSETGENISDVYAFTA
jgi:hypothetical protein